MSSDRSKSAAQRLASAHDFFRSGDIANSLDQLDKVAPADRSVDWHVLRAVSLAMRGDLAAAENILQQQLSMHPENLALRINLGMVQRDGGNLEAALNSFAIARAQHPDSVVAWHNLGLTQTLLRDWNNAAESLYQAAQRAPEQLEIRIQAALALARGGHNHAAQAALASLAEQPSLTEDGWMQMGLALMALKENAAAQQAFDQVLEKSPQNAKALIHCALLKEQANQTQEAGRLLGVLTKEWKQQPLACLVQSRLSRRMGHYDEALSVLPTQGIHSPDLAVEIQFEKARLLDSLGRFDEAFAAATIANQGAQQLRPGPEQLFDDLLAASVNRDDVAQWPTTDHSKQIPPQPIFFVGLPRSGSTLLDLMLDGHSQLQVLSEKSCLEELIPQIEDLAQSQYPEALSKLREDQIPLLQLRYFESAERELKIGRTPGTQLVDKNPLNLLRLALIRRIFPDALIIRSQRDIKDTALSCFLNDLGGRGAQGFWSIQQSVDLLSRLESFGDEQIQTCRLSPITVRYEDLVIETQPTLEYLCDALGIAFESGMLQTDKTAERRGAIGTPSYADVTRAPTASRIGHWQNYAKHFNS